MSESITNQEALSVLLGKRLAIWRRAANMLVLHFGQVTRKGDKSWGEYALHVQSPWRLLKDGAIFAGLSDLYSPREQTSDFDWDKWYEDADWPDSLLEYQLLSVLKGTDPVSRSLENTTDHFLVEKVQASDIGDAKLYLSGGYIWECFPDCLEGEHWRMLDTAKRKHFVVSGERRPTDHKAIQPKAASPSTSCVPGNAAACPPTASTSGGGG
jgi:hypothetical protein